MPAMVRAGRWVDATSIETEVARASRGSGGKRQRGGEPTVAVLAEVSQRTVAQMEVPTTDEG